MNEGMEDELYEQSRPPEPNSYLDHPEWDQRRRGRVRGDFIPPSCSACGGTLT